MPRTRPPYPPEFRQQMVELVRAGRSAEELARAFEPSAPAVRVKGKRETVVCHLPISPRHCSAHIGPHQASACCSDLAGPLKVLDRKQVVCRPTLAYAQGAAGDLGRRVTAFLEGLPRGGPQS